MLQLVPASQGVILHPLCRTALVSGPCVFLLQLPPVPLGFSLQAKALCTWGHAKCENSWKKTKRKGFMTLDLAMISWT